MANDIGITWTSDQRQLVSDLQKRLGMLEKDRIAVVAIGNAGKDAGAKLSASYADANREMSRLGRVAETMFKSSQSPMDAHLARVKELRVLYRMGKVDAEQFKAAFQGSYKKYFDDSGLTKQLADRKKLAAEEAQQATRRAAADRDERNRTEDFYAKRKEFWASEASQSDKDAAKKSAADREEAANANDFYAKRREHWTRQEADRQRDIASAKRSFQTEKQLALTNYRDRLAQLQKLRADGSMSAKEYQVGLVKINEELKKATHADLSSSFRDALGPMASFVTAAGTVGAAISAIKKELVDLRESQKKSLDVQKPYAEEFRLARSNLGEQTPQKFEWLDQEVQKLSKEIGMGPAETMRGVGAVLGAKGGGSDESAIKAFREAALFSGNKPELVESTASSIAQTKAFQPQMTDKEMLGRFVIARRETPTADKGFFENVAPQLGLGTNKDSMGGASALWGYFANSMQDKEGNLSVNSMIHMQKLMAETMSDVEGTTDQKLKAFHSPKHADRRAGVLGKFFSSHGLDEKQIAELGELGEKDKIPGYAKAFAPSLKLLRGDKDAVGEYNRLFAANTVAPRQAEGVVDTLNKNAASNPRLRREQASRQAKASIDVMRLNDPGSAVSDVRHTVDEALQATGRGSLYRSFGDAMGFVRSRFTGQSESQVQVGRLRNEIQVQRNLADQQKGIAQQPDWMHAATSWIHDPRQQAAKAAGEHSANADKLAQVLERLEKMLPTLVNQGRGGNQQPAPAAPPNVNVTVVVPEGGKAGRPPAAGLGARH